MIVVLLVFLSASLVDFKAVNYIKAVKDSRGHAAGCWSIANALVAVIGVSVIVKYSFWYLIPECAGLYIGTRVANNFKKKEKKPLVELDNID